MADHNHRIGSDEEPHSHHDHHHNHTDHICNHPIASSDSGTSIVYTQSLDELEFQRGLWTASINGDVNKVNRLLSKESKANLDQVNRRDESGYVITRMNSTNYWNQLLYYV